MRRPAAALALLLLGGGCDHRVEECNALIKVINQTQAELDGLQGQADAPGIRKFADELDSVAKKVASVDVKLAALQGLRERYRALVTEYATALRDLADAQDREDVAKIQEAAAHGNRLEKDSTTLIVELNAFCGGK
jgi:hypothetical protein